MAPFLNKLRPNNGREDNEIQPDTDAVTPAVVADVEKAGNPDDESIHKVDSESQPTQNAQAGVRKIEAVTLVWTKKSLAAALILIWILFLTNGFKGNILISLMPYVTSEWRSHSLLTVIGIVSEAMTAATYIPMAKVLDVWGRAEGFLIMVCFSTLGLILMAVSQNLATFCAAQVFYSVGFAGVIYSIVVIASDATNLKNRGLAFAFTSSPYMITAFAGSKAAEGFYFHVHWRWGFGAFAIILPFVATPLYALLKYNIKKAEKQAIVFKESTTRSKKEKFLYYLKEFDIPGVLLFAGGLTIFLLPFNLAASAPQGWRTGYIIAMIILGFLLLITFGLYQKYLSPSPFLNHQALTDRTVIGACLLNMTYQISYFCWVSYFTSFLQVVANLSLAEAGYVNSTFQVVSGVVLFIVGYMIRRTGRFRWILIIGVPLYIFFQGLMIHFRQPNVKVGYIVMCEIFISIPGSIFVLCCQLAVLAAVEHQFVAAVLALLFVFGGIGNAVGSTISGAIWTNTFLPALMRYLPESELPNVVAIYTQIEVQLSYPVGSPERLAIQKAYGYAQSRMLAAGTGIMVLSFIWVFLIRNYNVAKMTQTKGTVF